MGWAEATRRFLAAVVRRFYYLIVGFAFATLGVVERVTHREVSVPPWVTWVLLGLGFLIACIGAYRELANRTAAVTEQLGHRIREDFRTGVRPLADGTMQLLLQKHSLDRYVAIECVVKAGMDRWTSGDRSDPGNASSYGNPLLGLIFPTDFEGTPLRAGVRNYDASFIVKRRVGEVEIEDTEVGRVGFVL